MQEVRPGGIQGREVVLEERAVVFGAAGYADCAAEVAVEFERADGGVGLGVEGIDVCRDLSIAMFV